MHVLRSTLKEHDKCRCARPGEVDTVLVLDLTGGNAGDLALVSLQQVMLRIEGELLEMRQAAWRQHKAQPQISRLRARTGAARAAVSVAVSNLQFRASESVVAAHFSVVGPVVRVTILYSKQKGARYVTETGTGLPDVVYRRVP